MICAKQDANFSQKNPILLSICETDVSEYVKISHTFPMSSIIFFTVISFSHPDFTVGFGVSPNPPLLKVAPGHGLKGFALSPPVGNFTLPRRNGLFILFIISQENTKVFKFAQKKRLKYEHFRRLNEKLCFVYSHFLHCISRFNPR